MQQRSARSAAVRQWVLQDRQVLAETTPSQNGKVSSSQPASLIMPTASPRRKRQPASSPRAARPPQRPTSRQPLSPTASSQPAYPIMQASSPRMGRPPQQPQTRQPSPDADQQRMPPQQPQTRQPSPDVDQQRMPPQQPQTRQAPPDMDELRRLAYQQRQQQRRKRVITPKMLKARPIEIKQNVVMRSKHKGSAGSVTSEISHRSDITEKVTNSKERLRRNSNEIERLETLQSMETFESLKEEVENKMAMANTLLAEATEAKRQAQLEIAEERERLKAAEDAREAALAEAQRQSQIAQDEEKRRQEVEQARLLLEEQLKIAADGERQAKMAEAEQRRLLREEENRRKLEDEEKRKAQERAEERIRMLEAEKMRLDQEHKTALAEAQRKALIAQGKEKRRQKVEEDRSQLDEQLRIEVDRQAKIIAAAQKRFFKAPAAEAEQNRIAQKQVAKKIAMLEAEQKRLDQEHKRALEEAQKQAKIAADEEKRRLEVEQNKRMLEKQLRIEVDRHAQIASAEQQRRLEAEEARLKLEEEAQRQAQIAADEGQKRLEAESRKLELEQEAQKQAQIAAESEKKRWEAERMRLQLEARVLAENTKRDADEETRKWFDIKRMHVGRQAAEAARLKSPVSKEVKKEAFPDTQSCSGFFVSEGVSECSSDEEGEIIRSNSTLKEAVEIELPSSQESTKIGEDIVNDEHLTNSNPSSLVGSTSFDVGRVTVRHEVRRESPSIYSAPVISSSSRREKSTTKTKSFGFKSLWSTNKDPEQEVKAEQADQTASTSAQSCSSSLVGSTSGVTSCESRWMSRTFRELAAEQGNDFLAMDNEALRLLDLACLQAEERAEDTMNEIQSVTSLIEQERHEMEHVNGVVSVDFEEVKEVMDDSGNAEGEVNEEKSKKSRNLFKSLRGGKKSDKAKKGNESDTEQMSVSCSVSRVKELELELLEQSEQIAEKKKEAYNLLTELKSNSSVNQAIQRGPGKASEEKDRMKTSFFPDKISQDTVEEAIEVMPTLSEVDFISVNTPLSIDESAFAHKPNLLQRTGSLIKRNPLSRNESFTKMSKEEKRAFRHGKAMAKVDNRFQEIVEVKSGCDGGDEDGEKPKEASPNVCGGKDDNKMISNDWLNENATFVSENGASFIDSNDPTYDEDVAILVANTSDSTAYEEDNVDDFVVSSSSASQAQFNPPEKFIQIPTKRVPVQRVRSKEIAVQTDGYPMTTPRMMSPRPTSPQLMSPGAMSPRPTNTQKESFFETAALIGSTACMGGGRAILACADTCNENNPDSRVHDAYNRSSSYPGSPTASSVNYYDPDSSLASSVNYYNPTSPAASSMFRSGNAAYSKDEEDLVTRAFVNALQRVDSALHLAEEKKALEEEEGSELEYSARRKPRRHSKRQVKFDDIMSVDGRYVSAREQAKRRQERVPRNLALKPRMQTPRGSDQVWREELGSPREQWREELGSPREQWREELGSPREQWREEISSPREKKKGLGKKMFNGIKKLTKVRIVYDD